MKLIPIGKKLTCGKIPKLPYSLLFCGHGEKSLDLRLICSVSADPEKRSADSHRPKSVTSSRIESHAENITNFMLQIT